MFGISFKLVVKDKEKFVYELFLCTTFSEIYSVGTD